MQEILSKRSRELIQQNPLFSSLTPEQMEELLGLMYEERVSVGVNVVQEGEPGDAIYIICSGTGEVLKEDDHGEYHHIAILKPGDVIGEISLIDKRPRSATVRAVEDMMLVGLNVNELEQHSKPEVSLSNILKVNFAKTLSQNIRNLNTKAVVKLKDQLKYSQKQVILGQYIFRLMTLVCIYVLSMSTFNSIVHLSAGTVYLCVPVIVVFALAFYQLLDQSGFSPKAFGATLNGWEYALKDGALISIVFMMPMILFCKLVATHMLPSMADAPVFFYKGILKTLSRKEQMLLLVSFGLYVPAIEFIARGVCQTSFMTFLSHKNRQWQAILLAALFFSLSHVHISVLLAFATFVLSLFWGWLYTRHSTLIGVIVSHWLLTYFAIFVVGFDF
ncbi:MAG: cyclic nucleotide-binding domain-containing protein [Gammaproteobacteria bacterium]